MVHTSAYDERTEFLTRHGWKLGIDVHDLDVLLGYLTYPGRGKSGSELECDGVCGWRNQTYPCYGAEYQGRMHHYSDGMVDLMVTPGHLFWAAPDERARYYREHPGIMDFCGRFWAPPVYRRVTVEELQDGNEWLIPIPRPDTKMRHAWLDNLAVDEKNIGPHPLDPSRWTTVDYTGFIFCPSPLCDFVMTRRNGKAQIAGTQTAYNELKFECFASKAD